MLKGKNNILTTIILLIFIGQASVSFAVSRTISGQVGQPTHHSNMQLTVRLDHSDHSMSELESSDSHDLSTMENCCTDGNDCSMSGCAMIAVVSEIFLQSNRFIQKNAISDYPMAPGQILSSLYRPPILF